MTSRGNRRVSSPVPVIVPIVVILVRLASFLRVVETAPSIEAEHPNRAIASPEACPHGNEPRRAPHM